jgi:tripartite-type tricarboxylate transporter receptor subunit TctC
MPKSIVDALVTALQKALKDPALINRFAELSLTPSRRSERRLRRSNAYSRQRIDKWDRIIKEDSARSIMSIRRLCFHVSLQE